MCARPARSGPGISTSTSRKVSEQLELQHAFNFTILSLPVAMGCGFRKWRCKPQRRSCLICSKLTRSPRCRTPVLPTMSRKVATAEPEKMAEGVVSFMMASRGDWEVAQRAPALGEWSGGARVETPARRAPARGAHWGLAVSLSAERRK